MKRRRRSGYAYRDPAEPPKRKRPYERHANLVLDKRVLRRMALQAIGRPDIAQGPLHDTLLEMYPDQYDSAIREAEMEARRRGKKMVVMFVPADMRKNENPFYVRGVSDPLLRAGISHELKEIERGLIRVGLRPRVVVYVSRAGRTNP